MATFPPFGNMDTPFAEPAWYRGVPTPYYKEKHARWRKQVRDFVDTEIRPNANEWDEKQNVDFVALRKKAYDAGILSPCWPKEYGGTPPEGGWDHFMDLIWHDELSRSGCAGVNIVLIGITCMSVPHILRYGSEALKQKFARPVIEGKEGMSVTLTEPEGGSDLANLQTTAVKTPDGKHYVVNGAKKFITGGLTSRYFSTLVRTGKEGSGYMGTSLIVIEKECPGVEVTKLYTQGWWAGNTTRVVFNNVLVPVENLIGKENYGFSYMVDVMNNERMVAIYGGSRGCRGCCATAIEFARERNTFGKRLIDHQAIRHKIAHMVKATEAVHAVSEQITFQLEAGAKPKDVGGPIALLKVQTTQALEFCVREASQILGGASFLRSGKGQFLERAVREVRVATVGGGSEEIMLDLAMRMAKL